MAEVTHFLDRRAHRRYVSMCGVNLVAKHGINSSALPCDGWSAEWRRVDCEDCLAWGAEQYLTTIPERFEDDAGNRMDIVPSPGGLKDLIHEMNGRGYVHVPKLEEGE